MDNNNIERLPFFRLRNDEHFQIHSEIIREINTFGAEALDIKSRFDAYVSLFGDEDTALKKIIKSIYTDDIHHADNDRDNIFRGMTDANKSALRHFREEVRIAAEHLKVLFDTYGNVAIKPINEETSAITNMLQDLKGRFAADVVKVGIGEWITELETHNNRVQNLIVERYNEEDQKTDIVLKKARANVDEAYNNIAKRIEALCLINEDAIVYRNFINKLNLIIHKYKNTLAQRTGRAKKIKN